MTYDPDDPLWATPDIAAHMADVQVSTIRQWKARNLIRANSAGMYSLRDVENWLQQRNQSQVRKLSADGETMCA
jgi:DNA-binding transcriptional MerR regulator